MAEQKPVIEKIITIQTLDAKSTKDGSKHWTVAKSQLVGNGAMDFGIWDTDILKLLKVGGTYKIGYDETTNAKGQTYRTIRKILDDQSAGLGGSESCRPGNGTTTAKDDLIVYQNQHTAILHYLSMKEGVPVEIANDIAWALAHRNIQRNHGVALGTINSKNINTILSEALIALERPPEEDVPMPEQEPADTVGSKDESTPW